MKFLKIPPGGTLIEKGSTCVDNLVVCYSDGSVKKSKAVSSFIIYTSGGELLQSDWKALAYPTLDSNVPELEALALATRFCVQQEIKNAVFYCDSYQALNFITLESNNIKKYPQTQEIVEKLLYFDYCRIQNIARKHNKADALCQKGLKLLNIK